MPPVISGIQKFNMIRDINGYNGFGLQFTGIFWQGLLSQGISQSITIPASPWSDCSNLILIFYFQPGSSVWVARNSTATFPSGAVTLCLSEGNPTARQVYAGDVISFITNDATKDEFGAALYAFSGTVS